MFLQFCLKLIYKFSKAIAAYIQPANYYQAKINLVF